MQSGVISQVQTEAMVQLPMRVNNSSVKNLFIPMWDNTWVYNASILDPTE